MARRLNKRLVVSVLVFIGVPVVILIFGFSQGWFSTGDPKGHFGEAKRLAAQEHWAQAWIAISNAIRAGGGSDPDIQFARADIAMHQNPPAVQVALKSLQAAVAQKPDFVEAQRNLAELYLAVRYWKEAKTEIDRLIELDPSFGKAYLWGAVVEMAYADAEPNQARKTPYYEAAIARCRAGLEKAPDQLDLYRMLAQIYERMGQKEKVDEVVDLAVANNPAMPEAYIIKASRLLSLDRTDEAAAVLKKGMEKIGEDPKLAGALGEVAMRNRDFDLARECFTKVLAADPKNESGYLRLATMYRMDAERQKALGILTQGLEQLPDSVAIRAEVADICLEMGDIPKAEAEIAAIEKAVPDAPVVSYLRGKRALIGRQVRQAITYLEQASGGGILQARLLLGRAYLLADELGAAQRVLENLTAAEPGLISAWRALAEVQFRLRDFDKAGRSAKVVLESNPDDTGMHLLLAQVLVTQKRPQEALKEAQQAAERAKDTPDPYLLMADIYRATNRLAEAEEMFRRAIDVGQDVGRAYQRLIEFLRATNQEDKIQPVLDAAKKTLPPEDYAVVAGEQKDLERELKERTEKATATPSDVLTLARFYQLTGRAEPAKEALSEVLSKAEAESNDWRQAWQQLFLLHLAGGDYEKASELVSRLKEVAPSAPELLIADPLLALSQDRLDEAAAQLRAVTETHKTLSQAHFLLGQVLARQRRWDEAVAALTQALDTRPNLLEARLLLGRICLAQGNLAGAMAEAAEALKFEARLVPALELKAAAQVGLGAWDAATQVREEISRIVPDNVENLVALAALYLQQRQPEKAEAVFKRAYPLAPDNAVLVRAFANFYAETGRPREGEAIVEAYVDRHKDESSAYVVRGEFTAKVGGLEQAEPYFQKAVELAPTDPSPLIFLGDQYAMIGQWDKASAAYLRAIERALKDMTPRKRLADVYMLQGQLAEAKTVIEEVLKHSPKDEGALVVAGRIASRQGRLDEAKKRMEEALAIDPHYGEAIVRLAELYVGPDPMRALDMLARVDPSDPSFEKAMLLRSDINTRRALLTDAVLDLRRLLDFRPTSVMGRRALASKYMALQKPDLAAEILAQLSKEQHDQDPVLLVSLGDAYQGGKRYAEALGCYEKVRSLRPELVEALVGEARVLVAMNRKSEAIDRVHHVMDLYPNEVWPRVALVEIYERSGEPDKAVETLRTALLRRENWEEGYVYLAALLNRMGKMEESRQVLLTGLNRVPESFAIRASLASVDMVTGQSQEAQEILQPVAQKFESLYNQMPEELEKLRPYTGALRLYSLALYNLGRIEEALKYGMMLWKVDPTNVVNANNTAWILATEKKDFLRATEMIRRAMQLVPNHPQVLDTAGWIAFLNNRYEEAANYLLESIKYGDNAEAHYHLGRLYEARQRPEEARQEYQKALQMGLKVKDKADVEKRLEGLKAASG